MSLLAITVAIATLFGWVPWPADLLPAATWIAWAGLVIGCVDFVVSVLIKVIDR